MGLYSLLSLVGFIAMVWGFGEMRPWQPIWSPPNWTRHVAMTLMLPAILLIVAAYVPTGYIKKAVGHPMLTAVTLWALAHLTANGDLGSMILFGSFLIFGSGRPDRGQRRRGDRGAAAANPNILGDLLAVAVGGGALRSPDLLPAPHSVRRSRHSLLRRASHCAKPVWALRERPAASQQRPRPDVRPGPVRPQDRQGTSRPPRAGRRWCA